MPQSPSHASPKQGPCPLLTQPSPAQPKTSEIGRCARKKCLLLNATEFCVFYSVKVTPLSLPASSPFLPTSLFHSDWAPCCFLKVPATSYLKASSDFHFPIQ